ncbi:MAG: OmpH family outer membrane protein [Blastocatellia bacterium]
MKMFRQFIVSAFLFSVAAFIIHAQPPAKPASASSVAVIDTNAFLNEQSGIRRLLAVYKQLNTEFASVNAELEAMQKRIVAMNTEINKMGKTPGAQAKEEEVFRLQRDLDTKKQAAISAFEKRRVILVAPIEQHIGKALQEFISAHGINVLLDASKLQDALLAATPTADVTKAFIDEYNTKYPTANGVANNR